MSSRGGRSRKSSSQLAPRTSFSISCVDLPAANVAPTIAPMLVPVTQLMGTRNSSSTLSTPTCAMPRAPPPDSARPMRGAFAVDATTFTAGCADAPAGDDCAWAAAATASAMENASGRTTAIAWRLFTRASLQIWTAGAYGQPRAAAHSRGNTGGASPSRKSNPCAASHARTSSTRARPKPCTSSSSKHVRRATRAASGSASSAERTHRISSAVHSSARVRGVRG